MVDRQVRYNIQSTYGEATPHKWVFLIINEPREIKIIKERIFQQLEPIADLKSLEEGLIQSSEGLHMDYFCFKSSKGKIEDSTKIYNSKKFKKDTHLIEKDDIWAWDYINSIKQGKR